MQKHNIPQPLVVGLGASRPSNSGFNADRGRSVPVFVNDISLSILRGNMPTFVSVAVLGRRKATQVGLRQRCGRTVFPVVSINSRAA